jgi:nitrate reductase NapD
MSGANVIGVLVHGAPDRREAIGAALAEMPGVEVHEAFGDGRFVVVAEDVPGRYASDSLMAFHQIPGVISAALVFHGVDDGAASDENQTSPGAATHMETRAS